MYSKELYDEGGVSFSVQIKLCFLAGFHCLLMLSLSSYWGLLLFFRCDCWYCWSANAELPENIWGSCFSRTQGQGCHLRRGERNHGGVHKAHWRSCWACVPNWLRWVWWKAFQANSGITHNLHYNTKDFPRQSSPSHGKGMTKKWGYICRYIVSFSPP